MFDVDEADDDDEVLDKVSLFKPMSKLFDRKSVFLKVFAVPI